MLILEGCTLTDLCWQVQTSVLLQQELPEGRRAIPQGIMWPREDGPCRQPTAVASDCLPAFAPSSANCTCTGDSTSPQQPAKSQQPAAAVHPVLASASGPCS